MKWDTITDNQGWSTSDEAEPSVSTDSPTPVWPQITSVHLSSPCLHQYQVALQFPAIRPAVQRAAISPSLFPVSNVILEPSRWLSVIFFICTTAKVPMHETKMKNNGSMLEKCEKKDIVINRGGGAGWKHITLSCAQSLPTDSCNKFPNLKYKQRVNREKKLRWFFFKRRLWQVQAFTRPSLLADYGGSMVWWFCTLDSESSVPKSNLIGTWTFLGSGLENIIL